MAYQTGQQKDKPATRTATGNSKDTGTPKSLPPTKRIAFTDQVGAAAGKGGDGGYGEIVMADRPASIRVRRSRAAWLPIFAPQAQRVRMAATCLRPSKSSDRPPCAIRFPATVLRT